MASPVYSNDLSPEMRAFWRREAAILLMSEHGIRRERAAMIYDLLAERRDIHLAACRYRRQGLCCGTCSSVTERVERLGVAR